MRDVAANSGFIEAHRADEVADGPEDFVASDVLEFLAKFPGGVAFHVTNDLADRIFWWNDDHEVNVVKLDVNFFENHVGVLVSEIGFESFGKIGVNALKEQFSPVLGYPDDVIAEFVGHVGLGADFHAHSKAQNKGALHLRAPLSLRP